MSLQPSAGLSLLSAALGWTYTLLWSASFYPQAINNFHRKSTRGFSTDFAHVNALGFACYAAYNLAFLLSEKVQDEYRQRHGGRENVVRWNDAAFAVHAFVLSVVLLGQVYRYDEGRRRVRSGDEERAPLLSSADDRDAADRGEVGGGGGGGVGTPLSAAVLPPTSETQTETSAHTLSPFARYTVWALSLLILLACLAASLTPWLALLDVVNLLSAVKLYITLTKYFPQLSLNARRKSTRGYSIENVLLDFIGGVLSLAQLVLDAGIINRDWSAIVGDFGKLGLGLLSLGFDVALLTQHYILYGPVEARSEGGEQSSVIEEH